MLEHGLPHCLLGYGKQQECCNPFDPVQLPRQLAHSDRVLGKNEVSFVSGFVWSFGGDYFSGGDYFFFQRVACVFSL